MNPGPAERISSCCGRCGGTAPGTFPRALRGTQIRGTCRAGLRRLPLALGGPRRCGWALTAPASGFGGKASRAFLVPRQRSPPLFPAPAPRNLRSGDVRGPGGRSRRRACECAGSAGALPGLPGSCCSRWEPEDAVPHPHRPSWARLVLEVAGGTCPEGVTGQHRWLCWAGSWDPAWAALAFSLARHPWGSGEGESSPHGQLAFSTQKRAAHRSCQAG